MFAIVAEFRIAPDRIRDFAAIIDRQARDSLANEPDCHYFDVCQDEADPGLFLLYEIYTDADAYQAHRLYPHSKAFQGEIKPMVVEVKVRRFNRRPPG
jgi:quinol monooxygenase YgiN